MPSDIDKRLTLCAARQPRTESAALMLEAVEEILRLRASVRYERARCDVNDHTEELRLVWTHRASDGPVV